MKYVVWIISGILLLLVCSSACYRHVTVSIPAPPAGLVEAPTGFDNNTNGFTSQTQHDADRDQFEEDAGAELGPVFNAKSCADCHSNPVTGAGSQVTEHRIAPDDKDDNIALATLIHDQSTDPALQQSAPHDAINALRISLSLMGDGFVEQVPDEELLAIAKVNGGEAIMVPLLENPKVMRVGRFGWKDQHASLFSFAGDADFNEKGVCNSLLSGSPACSAVGVIEDQQAGSTTGCSDPNCEDIFFYASFTRALKAPPRGSITTDVLAGQKVFERVGCSNCHVESLYTKGMIPRDVVFHPFGDYLLHALSSADGIQQGAASANKMRTAPLWGLRTRPRLFHDGLSFNVIDAIKRHGREAEESRENFKRLNQKDKQAILAFLASL